MAYKRYFYRNGKKYGPYYYESYRDENGKVRKRYVKKSDDKKSVTPTIRAGRNYLFFVVLAVLFLFMGFIIFYQFNSTGRVGLEIDKSFVEGEGLSGTLRFNLREGELIPADSVVRVSLGSLVKEVKLSELVSAESVNGDFFAEGVNLSGRGKGYGVSAGGVVYPEVDFQLLVFVGGSGEVSGRGGEKENKTEEKSEAEKERINKTEEKSEEVSGEGGVNEVDKAEGETEKGKSAEEIVGSEEGEKSGEAAGEADKGEENAGGKESEVVESGSDSNEGVISEESGITGAVIKENEFVVSGRASKDNDFVYELEAGRNAEIVEGSVKVDGEIIGDSEVSLEVGDSAARVSTEYGFAEEGFGEEYLGEQALTLEIDLGKFGINASAGELRVELVYDGEEIVSASEEVVLQEGNVTLQNATLEEVNVTGVVVNVTQFKARLGEPVKWVKKVNANGPAEVVVEIPLSAENISVRKILKERVEEENINEGEINNETASLITGRVVRVDIHGDVVSGKVSADLDLKKEPRIVKWFKGVLKLTGFAVEGDEVQEVFVEINSTEESAEIEYYTDAPSVGFEEETEKGKMIQITSPDDVHYTDVLIFTNLSEGFDVRNQGRVKIYWVEGDQYLPVTSVYDLDSNGIYDYVEWIAPQLSNQTFEIILITKAEHLDSNREFVEDIYESVKSQDGNWSFIPAGEFVRVTFERALDRTRDITIYARASCVQNSSVVINGIEVPCEIFKKKLRLDEIRRENG